MEKFTAASGLDRNVNETRIEPSKKMGYPGF